MLPINFYGKPTIGGVIGFLFLFTAFMRKKTYTKKTKGLFIKQRPEKKCFKCQGFGIIRCDLCSGKGFVFYERKYQRSDPCPKCFQKRYDMCPFCQGNGERSFLGKTGSNKYNKKIFRIFE
ncbi:hypothetical protein CMESO_340 (nucleomorph) [Chroomonas mesostigmatica CCMP1168]|uniref:Uncharacterized protein n=1 Tax=Chroomonas mesostigmatica CCMP1168 TaxID=1195612 RepID=J7G200_9CRYP|nr:hypothetical protein CMESO_340 [Chroomonas mesostigmatica CCMP1168]